jgi:glycosyltransferase involved in cell wall biosynthesis
MRIGLLTFEYPSEGASGGIGSYCAALAAGLRDLGHEPIILLVVDELAAQSGPSYLCEGIRVEKIRAGRSPIPFPIRGSGLLLGRRIAAAAARLELDVLEAPDFLGMTAFLDFFRPKFLRVVVRLHTSRMISRESFRHLYSGVSARWQHAVEQWAEARAIRGSDALTAVSQAVVDATRAKVSFDGGVEVFPSPVRELFFQAPSQARTGKTILVVGRLEWIKGTERVIAAMPETLKRNPDAEFVFVGSDTETAPGGESMLRLAQRTLPPECRGQMRHVPWVAPEELVKLYAGAAICVAMSRWEGLPVAVQEAMAAGRPVIASDAPAMRELVSERTGVIVAGDDSSALAAAISRLLADDRLRDTMGKCARRYAEENFRSSMVAAKALRVYERVLVSGSRE